jgi:hypothetical protein
MAHGGRRPNAGRKPGSVTTRTREIAEAIAADGDLTPLDYLTSVYRDPQVDESRRIDAAKAAAPYVHAKLQTTTLQGPDGGPVETLQRVERVIVDPANPDS